MSENFATVSGLLQGQKYGGGYADNIRLHMGREQLKNVDAYAVNPAVMIAVQGGLDTTPITDAQGAEMVLTGIDRGDFLKVQGVDFGEKAPTKWNAYIKKADSCGEDCVIQLRIGKVNGQIIGYLTMEEATEQGEDGYCKYTAELLEEVTDVHDLYMIFSGSDYEMKNWYFE